MKLRTKLLLGVGILLLVMALLMYILPSVFIRRDVYRAVDSIHNLLIKDQQQLIHSQQMWLEDELTANIQNNDALLIMLSEDLKVSQKLHFGSEDDQIKVWTSLAHMIGYDPSIGFVQAHAPKGQKTAVILPDAAQLYSVDKLIKKDGAILISIPSKPFVGVPLPQEMQPDTHYTLYALVNPEKAPQELAEVHEEIAKLSPELIRQELSAAEHVEEAGDEKSGAFTWALKVNSIRILTPLYAEGLKLGLNKKLVVPEALARVDRNGRGYVILAEEVFSTKPLFDDVNHYDSHPPKPGTPPVAHKPVVITADAHGNAYIGNTAQLDGTYLTIASPLSSLARQLALSSNRMVLLRVQEKTWIGFTGDGQRLSEERVKEIIGTQSFEQPSGTLKVGKEQYAFSLISTLSEGQLAFYDFHPLKGEKSILNTLLSLENKLSNRISAQLALIAIGTMILVLLFIGRILFSVIEPIRKLAHATHSVASGNYHEVALPEVGDRQDEVATLTRSFGEMVTGLQERENIRAVLDKVVSKEVAEEILKTHIHLGGEDRVVSMLFGDVRDFTQISSTLAPQEVIHMLNVCMTKVSKVIEGEGGVIDKYVGDEVMAIFGAPAPVPNHAQRAISSAMLIIEMLKKWNEERVAAGEVAIEMGIGVHTGVVVAGNMGAEDRLNYTVVGANVNLAARLCEAAKPNQLIISAATLAEPDIEASFYAQALPPVHLKGFAEPIQVYEITGFKWEE